MKIWQHYSIEDRLELLSMVRREKPLTLTTIEKDWWVTMVLKALSLTQYASLMSFKGGTSLSKGWDAIGRFSEDIDIALKREDRFAISSTSKSQLAKLRKAARHYIVRELPIELDDALHSLGVSEFSVEPLTERKRNGVPVEIRVDAHPSDIFVKYKSIVSESSEYVEKEVKIEISCLSMDEPVENKPIRSFISEVVPDAEETAVEFKTVVPTRTFLEKIFLLHEEFQKDHPRFKRMSRHLYDLEKLMDSQFGQEALENRALYDEIVEHRRIFNNIPYVDYTLHDPRHITIIPPENQLAIWENDYNELIMHLLSPTKHKLTFAQLIERMKALQDRIRSM